MALRRSYSGLANTVPPDMLRDSLLLGERRPPDWDQDMAFNEADTRAKLINPALYGRGWTEDLISREETAGTVEIINGRARRRARGRADYVLRVKVEPETQPVAVGLIEAKKDTLPPGHGLSQAKAYARCERLNVPFVFSSNGHMFVEYDRSSGLTSGPRPMGEFPSPCELRKRYEAQLGCSLACEVARPLITPYPGGEGTRRYYQDAAIRAVMEKTAKCELAGEPKRALLSLATGAGKTFIAVNLLRRIADAGRMTRALFVCDRDELRTQALGAFQNAFGANAAEVRQDSEGRNEARNARVHIATYQTLGVENDVDPGQFLTRHYPEGYFSHIIIDECHRSAWGKWSHVLTRFPDAAHIGLTATPRRLKALRGTKTGTDGYAADPLMDDAKIIADNLKYFGQPVYSYELAQGIEDGYLAACEVYQFDLFHDNKSSHERAFGVAKDDIKGKKLTDAKTGQAVTPTVLKEHYRASSLEDKLLLPERVEAMCSDLFQHLLDTGGPEQKTIVFCTRDHHADAVASEMGNLYARWCKANGRKRCDQYAFKCTAAASGNDQLPDLRASSRSHFIATTVDLLTTGVDVPCVRNIVFFKYINSPISFYQMVGRGTRIDAATGKLMFRVYDYTDATRLFGKEFITRKLRAGTGGGPEPPPPPPDPPEPTICVEGVQVQVTPAGHAVLADVDGRAMPVPIEEYKARLAASLVQEAHTLGGFRQVWIDPPARHELLENLVRAGYSPSLVRSIEAKDAYDLYDVLAELGWGMAPRTRHDRALAFTYKHEQWVKSFPDDAATTIQALASQFEKGGTDSLENPRIFHTPEVTAAGGLPALRVAGNPGEILRETKARMFAA